MVRCNVKGCTRTQKQNKNHSFFSEPKNLMIRKQWRKFAGITNNPKDFRICSDHFELSCYRKRTPPRWLLYREAVPTIRTNSVPAEMGDKCVHTGNNIILDVEKATDVRPALVTIQTNSKINLVVKEDHSYASSAGTHSSSNASATISSPTPYQPSPTSTIRTSDQPSISASIDYSHNSVTLNTADKARMYVQENVSSSSTPVFSESIPKNFNNFNTIGICSSPVSSKLSSLNAKVSPNSRSQQSSRLLMTPSKKVSRVPRTLVFKNSTVPPKEAVTPKSLRIKNKNRLLAVYRSRILRLTKQKRNNPLVTNEVEIKSIINASSKFLDPEALAFFSSHLRLCNVSKNRRRFTNEVKDIALSIKYHSPKAYRYLSKFFHLPTERTLSNYQKQFPIL